MEAEFLQHDLTLLQSEGVFRLGTDAMVLADFVRLQKGTAVCDLCAGAGAVGMLLLAQDPGLTVTAVELQAEAVSLMEQTAARNGLEERLIPIRGDLREIRSLLPHGSFRHVVCNPPYYPVNSGFHARSEAQAVARTELCCTMENVLDAAAWLLPTGGTLWLVHKPERLADLLCGLRAHRLEPKVLRLVAHKPAAEPSLVLIKAVMGGKAALEVRPTLFLQTPDGSPTEEYRRIYHL
jgi:tRNA1Val (adenine37-N6)-methyltransferase